MKTADSWEMENRERLGKLFLMHGGMAMRLIAIEAFKEGQKNPFFKFDFERWLDWYIEQDRNVLDEKEVWEAARELSAV